MKLPGLTWPGTLSLRARLVLLIWGVTSVSLVGLTLAWLSSEITELEHRIATEGTVLAQSLSNSCAPLVEGAEPDRFDYLFARVRRTVDLVDAAVVDQQGVVVGHTDPAQLGKRRAPGERKLFGSGRRSGGLVQALGEPVLYEASAPVVRGTRVTGYVMLRFRSNEIRERALALLSSASFVALFWLLVGALGGSLFVRSITRPLVELTEVAERLTDGDLDAFKIEKVRGHDEIGVLQWAFGDFVRSLRAQRRTNDELLGRLQHLNRHLQERVDEVTAELRETNAYLASVMNCMAEGVVAVDAGGNVVGANLAAARQLHGLCEPRVGDLLPAVLTQTAGLDRAIKLAAANTASAELELVIETAAAPWRQDGVTEHFPQLGQRTLEIRVTPLLRDQERAVGAVLTLEDITDKRHLDDALRRRDRLASLGTIAAGLAHELGNYMHSIHGFSALLLQSMGPDDDNREDVATIQRDNRAAIALLERFLQFARVSDERRAPRCIEALLRQALSMCDYRVRKEDVELVAALPDCEHIVVCDAQAMTQVFINIILNALDAMQEQAEPRLEVDFESLRGDRVAIRFIDGGTGIGAEHVDRIFDPFYTTKTNTGTGLGLSIAHQVVQRHGGRLSARNRAEGGAVFEVVLPLAPDAEAARALREDTA